MANVDANVIYHVTATTIDGCTVEDTVAVVHPIELIPSIGTLNAHGDLQVGFCRHEVVCFQGILGGAGIGGLNPINYRWNFGHDATPRVAHVQNPCVTFSQAGTHTITLSVTNGCETHLVTFELSIENCLKPVTDDKTRR